METDAKGLNMEAKQHQIRTSSQPDKDTIGHEAEVKGSHNMKTKQHLAQNIHYQDPKAKKKCKYKFQLRFCILNFEFAPDLFNSLDIIRS